MKAHAKLTPIGAVLLGLLALSLDAVFVGSSTRGEATSAFSEGQTGGGPCLTRTT